MVTARVVLFLFNANRDKLSTRKFDVGVFTQPGSKAEKLEAKRKGLAQIPPRERPVVCLVRRSRSSIEKRYGGTRRSLPETRFLVAVCHAVGWHNHQPMPRKE